MPAEEGGRDGGVRERRGMERRVQGLGGERENV